MEMRVYYEELNYDYIQQKSAYTLNDFVSDMGGSMGLFLGASILTFVEFLEFVSLSILSFLKRCGFGRDTVGTKIKVQPQDESVNNNIYI